MPENTSSVWKISIDTGGTFTDLIAVDPDLGRPPGALACRDVDEIGSRLIFRERPGMVRAAWVRGRGLEGPAGA